MDIEAKAGELGYASRETVYTIVHTALAAHEAEQVKDLRALGTGRLDSLLEPVHGRRPSGPCC